MCEDTDSSDEESVYPDGNESVNFVDDFDENDFFEECIDDDEPSLTSFADKKGFLKINFFPNADKEYSTSSSLFEGSTNTLDDVVVAVNSIKLRFPDRVNASLTYSIFSLIISFMPVNSALKVALENGNFVSSNYNIERIVNGRLSATSNQLPAYKVV